MRKMIVLLLLALCIASNNTTYAQTVNKADTELSETLKYALINALRQPVDQSITEIYKNDKDAPQGLTWAAYDTEILKIKQLQGVGGAYEITLKVRPYYRAHITYGEDIVTVSADGELIDYKHMKTYPRVEFN